MNKFHNHECKFDLFNYFYHYIINLYLFIQLSY